MYDCLAKCGLISDVEGEKDQSAALEELIQLSIKHMLFLKRGEKIRDFIRNDLSDNLVISIGSAGNAEEACPSFTNNLEGTVSVCNIDLGHWDEDNIVPGKDSIKLKFFKQKFVNKYDTISKHEPHQKLQVEHNEKEISEYLEVLNLKKTQNKNFKLILLYSCSSALDEYLIKITRHLIESGFELGRDLELVHAYFATSPAVVYRNVGNIPIINPHLNTGPEYKITTGYDKNHDMYVFQRLGNINSLFNQLKSSSSTSYEEAEKGTDAVINDAKALPTRVEQARVEQGNDTDAQPNGFFNYMVSVMKRMYHNFLQLFRDFFGGGSASTEPPLNHKNLLNRLNDINCSINLKPAIIKTFSLQLQDIEKKDRNDPAAICAIANLQNDIDILITGQNVDDVINRAIQYLEKRSKQTYTPKTTSIISKIYYKQSEQDRLSDVCNSLKDFKSEIRNKRS